MKKYSCPLAGAIDLFRLQRYTGTRTFRKYSRCVEKCSPMKNSYGRGKLFFREKGGRIMWIVFAFGSALFAGITAILAKCGIRKTNSDVATAIRTVVVLAFSWLMVFLVGSQNSIASISGFSLLFLILSGLATGASWLCYFKALQLGDINKVVPIDKSSTVLTILLAFALLGEPISPLKGVAVAVIAVGTFLMIRRKPSEQKTSTSRAWMVYALLSAVFASLTAILGKIGIRGVESNLGTAIRTCVVLVMAWVVVFAAGEQKSVRAMLRKELGFICLSGIATGASWLCYYKALQDGLACVVVPIDKLSILVTVAFSLIVFKEKLSARAAVGLLLIVAGTLAMILWKLLCRSAAHNKKAPVLKADAFSVLLLPSQVCRA